MIRLCYPEKRAVTEAQVLIWHADAVDNGELTENTTNIQQALFDLEDLGHITVAS